MTKYKIILNPIADRGGSMKDLPKIEETLKRNNIDYDLVFTEAQRHAIDLAREAAESGQYDVVVAAGGDGTTNEVLNGLCQAKAAGAKIPTYAAIAIGRGNDFAYGANIPDADLDENLRILLDDHREVIDIGYVEGGDFPEGRYFNNCIGIGFDAYVGFVAVKLKPLSGFLNYLIAALLTDFIYFKAPTIELEYDDTKVTMTSLMVSVMNGKRLGGGFYMAPDASNQDGVFDLVIVDDPSRMRVLTLLPHFMSGTQATQKEVRIVNASRIKVKAIKGSIPAHVDGETLCEEGESVDIKLLSKHIEVVCRKPEE